MNQGPYGYPPPSGYGPPQQGYYGGPPPKKGMNGCLLALLIGGGMLVLMFGGCLMLGMVGAAKSSSSSSSVATSEVTSTSTPGTSSAVASSSAAPELPDCPARTKCIQQHKTQCTFTNTKQVSAFCLAFNCTNEVTCPSDPPHKHGHPLSEGPFDVAVKGSQLFNDYQENEVAADDKYKGKILLVMGDVSEIRKDFTGSVIIGLTTSNEFMPDDAYLADGQNAASLRKGHTVGLVCRGDGMIIGRPDLKDCEIVESMTGSW